MFGGLDRNIQIVSCHSKVIKQNHFFSLFFLIAQLCKPLRILFATMKISQTEFFPQLNDRFPLFFLTFSNKNQRNFIVFQKMI